MKHFKILLVSAVMAFSSAIFANPNDGFVDDKESASYEIAKLLDRSELTIEKEFNATIIFILSEDRRIQIYSIKSENEEVKKFLQDRLQNQKLTNRNWDTGKYYELPVKIQKEE